MAAAVARQDVRGGDSSPGLTNKTLQGGEHGFAALIVVCLFRFQEGRHFSRLAAPNEGTTVRLRLDPGG
jgi:hypothetical protein